MKRQIARALVCAAALAGAAGANAVTLPPQYHESTAIRGLDNPTAVRFAADGRVFVAEKSGLVKVFSSLADRTPTEFADLSTNVHNYWDRGLLGLALAPGFPADPYVYVSYTHDAEIGGLAPRWGTPGVLSDGCPAPSDTGCVVSGRVSRLQAAGDVMTGVEHVLVEDWCQQYPSHSVGDLVFGPDGALYASGGDGARFAFADYGQYGAPLNPCGDPPVPVGGQQTLPTAEGGALRSQDLLTAGDPAGLDGTIIRIDPATGAAMTGNPLWSDHDPNVRRIVAYGLRNPFRLGFRPGTSELWFGDVGYDTSEEIDVLASPVPAPVENYGWPCYEGGGGQWQYQALTLDLCQTVNADPSKLTDPFFHYSHDPAKPVYPGDPCPRGGASTSGIAFGSEASQPGYGGALFFADYARRCIWVAKAGLDGRPSEDLVGIFASNAEWPVDLEIGPGGDLFYVDIVGGTIRRIRHGENEPPVASAAASPVAGATPLEVELDGTGSTDPDPRDVLSYAWDLDGDGDLDDSTAAEPSHTYEDPASVTVTLEVTDLAGATDTDTIQIDAGNTPPDAEITTPTPEAAWRVGDEIAFSGSASDVDEVLGPERYTWSVLLHHCQHSICHVHEVQELSGSSGSFSAPNHAYPSYLELVLTVSDSHGGTDGDRVELRPSTVDLTFDTSPPGLRLVVDGEEVAPFTRRLIVGATATVTAPSPQAAGGTSFSFSSWSDDGARTHELTAPAGPATYTATFTSPPSPPPPPPVSPPPVVLPLRPPPPSPPAAAAKRCVVPYLVRRRIAVARRAVVASRCSVGRVSRAYSRTVRAGYVVAQSPRRGTRLAPKARVRLVVSRGRRR